VDFVSSTGLRGSLSFGPAYTLDLDNFHIIEVDFATEGGFLVITHTGFSKFW